MDESVGGFAGLKAGASFIELLLGLELFRRSRLPFHASHHGGGLLESGLGGSGIDGAAQFRLVHQNGDFIGIHFGETTHQGDGVPGTVGTNPQHTDVDGGEQGDVAGQDAE